MSRLQPYEKYNPVQYDYVDELPNGWQLLPNIALFQERIERGFVDEELLSVTIGKGVIKQTELNKKDSSTLDKSKYLLIHSGDLVYSMRFRQGASGYSNYKGIVSPACTVLKSLNSGELNKRFYFYLFRTSYYKNYIERYSYGIADGQIPLRYLDFKRMYSIVPPLATQNAIVNYLDKKTTKIQDFITKKERLIELLEEERREFIDQTIHRLTRYDTLNKPLKYLVKLVSKQTKTKNENEKYLALENIESWTGNINLSLNEVEFESSVKKFSYQDILFNKLRPYLAKVVIPDFNGVCVSELLVLKPNKEVLRKFLFYKLISNRFIDLVDSSTFGSKMPRANWDFIGKIELEFPESNEVQKQLIKTIEQKEEQLSILTEKYLDEIAKIKEYQESLITNVVLGKLRVPEDYQQEKKD